MAPANSGTTERNLHLGRNGSCSFAFLFLASSSRSFLSLSSSSSSETPLASHAALEKDVSDRLAVLESAGDRTLAGALAMRLLRSPLDAIQAFMSEEVHQFLKASSLPFSPACPETDSVAGSLNHCGQDAVDAHRRFQAACWAVAAVLSARPDGRRAQLRNSQSFFWIHFVAHMTGGILSLSRILLFTAAQGRGQILRCEPGPPPSIDAQTLKEETVQRPHLWKGRWSRDSQGESEDTPSGSHGPGRSGPDEKTENARKLWRPENGSPHSSSTVWDVQDKAEQDLEVDRIWEEVCYRLAVLGRLLGLYRGQSSGVSSSRADASPRVSSPSLRVSGSRNARASPHADAAVSPPLFPDASLFREALRREHLVAEKRAVLSRLLSEVDCLYTEHLPLFASRVNPLFRQICDTLRFLNAEQSGGTEREFASPDVKVLDSQLMTPTSPSPDCFGSTRQFADSLPEELRLQTSGHRAVEALEVVRLLSFLVRCLRSLPRHDASALEAQATGRKEAQLPSSVDESHTALFRAPRLIRLLRRHIACIARLALVGCLPPASPPAAACLALLDGRRQGERPQRLAHAKESATATSARSATSRQASREVLETHRESLQREELSTGEWDSNGLGEEAHAGQGSQEQGAAAGRTGAAQRWPAPFSSASQTKDRLLEHAARCGEEAQTRRAETRRAEMQGGAPSGSACDGENGREEPVPLSIRKARGRRRFACITLQDATNNLSSALDICKHDAPACFVHCQKLLWCLERLSSLETATAEASAGRGLGTDIPSDVLHVIAELLDCKMDKLHDREKRQWPRSARANRDVDEARTDPEALPVGTGAVETRARDARDPCPLESRVEALGRRRRRSRTAAPGYQTRGVEAATGDSPTAAPQTLSVGRERLCEPKDTVSNKETPWAAAQVACPARESVEAPDAVTDALGNSDASLDLEDLEEEEEPFLLLHNMLERQNPYAFPHLLSRSSDVGDELGSFTAVALEEREKQHQFAHETVLPFHARLAWPRNSEPLDGRCRATDEGTPRSVAEGSVWATAPFAFLAGKRARYRELEKDQQRVAQRLAGGRAGPSQPSSGADGPWLGGADSHEWWVVGGDVQPVPLCAAAVSPAGSTGDRMAGEGQSAGGERGRTRLGEGLELASQPLSRAQLNGVRKEGKDSAAKQPNVDVFRAARLAELEQATKEALGALVVSCCFPQGKKLSARSFQTALLSAIGAQNAESLPDALVGQKVRGDALSLIWPQIRQLARLLRAWEDCGPVFVPAVSVSTPCGAVGDTRLSDCGGSSEDRMWGDALCKIEGPGRNGTGDAAAQWRLPGVWGREGRAQAAVGGTEDELHSARRPTAKPPDILPLFTRPRGGRFPLSVYSVERRYWGAGDRKDTSHWLVSEVLVLLRKLQRAASELTSALEQHSVRTGHLLPQVVASREAESLLLTVVQGLTSAVGEAPPRPRLGRHSLAQEASASRGELHSLVQNELSLVAGETTPETLQQGQGVDARGQVHSRAMLLHATTGAVYGSLSRGWQWLILQRLGRHPVIPRSSALDIESRQRSKEAKAGLLSIQHLKGPSLSFVSPPVSPLALLVPPRPRRSDSKGPLSAALLPTASGARVLLDPHPELLRELGRRPKPAQGRMEGWLAERRKQRDKDEGLWLRRIDKLHSLLTMTLRAPRGAGGVNNEGMR
ncbi:conserved hypothetical protein [Neospora caninum Liverpool]|uniref:Uncharacterized protein n=1 Tax=Neospora caninum (strain Liverpool) TaxID=572307 RepID=F0VJU5_NEOCL|nr:conserved hypothetical protein [Neospora caninum Liverpool]CBZ54006.1 conserved hypothetical protein [Neospora caninum Liverpool]|eukprot:XP_003884038.1 conserved hypothetical protein [Neospora caninum Liverpool]